MGGSRNLVIFLGIALVIVRFLTSSQRSALAGLWNAGSSAGSTPMGNATLNPQPSGGAPNIGSRRNYTGK